MSDRSDNDIIDSDYFGALPAAFETRLGLALAELGFLTEKQLEEAWRHSGERHVSLPTSLEALQFVPRLVVLSLANITLGLPVTNLQTDKFDQGVLDLIPREPAIKHKILPVRVEKSGHLRLATLDPCDVDIASELERVSGHKIKFALTVSDNMEEVIERAYEQLRLKK